MTQYESAIEIEKLINDLQSNDKAVRIKAAHELGKIDPDQADVASKVLTALKKVADKDSYKLAKDIAKNSILKITEPKLAKDQAHQRQVAAIEQNQISEKSQSQYGAMRTLGLFYGILGWVVLGFSILSGIVGAISALENSPALALILFFGVPIFGAILALPMLAAQDFFSLLIDQARDIREIKKSVNDFADDE